MSDGPSEVFRTTNRMKSTIVGVISASTWGGLWGEILGCTSTKIPPFATKPLDWDEAQQFLLLTYNTAILVRGRTYPCLP